MKNIIKWIRNSVLIGMLLGVVGCQSVQPKQEEIIQAATAYSKGFIQGNSELYDTYYGKDMFSKAIEGELEENKEIVESSGLSAALWKEMFIKSRKMYAKAEIVSITKKDETTALIKIRPISVKDEDRMNWTEKKRTELESLAQNGDEQAIEKLNAIVGEVFDAVVLGEIASTLEPEITYEMKFAKKDGKLFPTDDQNEIIAQFFVNK